MNIIITGAVIFNGEHVLPAGTELMISGEQIAALAKDLPRENAEIYDACGKWVTPGFIDLHRHCDIAALYDPDFGKLELAQGIVSAFCGNCGLAPVPSSPDYVKSQLDYIEPCLGIPSETPPSGYRTYTDALHSRELPLNLGIFAASGAIKTSVRGFTRGEMTSEELRRCEALISDAMDCGAYGLTMGIMYAPECYSTHSELVAFARSTAKRGGVLFTHIRGEGDMLAESVDEAIRIARDAEIPLQISHFKATGRKNHGVAIHKAIERIETARAVGQDVTVDFYPYDCGATTMLSVLPPDCLCADIADTLKALASPSGRERLRNALTSEHTGWENMVSGISWEGIVVGSVAKHENMRFSGLSLAECAAIEGLDPVDFLALLLRSENGKVGAILRSMSPGDVDTVASLDYSCLISDALYTVGTPHPRLYGAFTRFIEDFCLNRGVLPLENAIKKMTSQPAKRVGLVNRGFIRENYSADLCVFNPDDLRSGANYTKPRVTSSGMSRVYLNGKVGWQNEAITANGFGRLLTKNS